MHRHMVVPESERPQTTDSQPHAAFPAACFAVVLAAAGVLCFFRIPDPDVFWHLKTGQVILETGRLIHTNLFSFTYPDFPWHNLEWLFEVVLALFYNAFGWGGVFGLKLGLVLATTALLTRTLLRKEPVPLLAAAVIISLLALMRFRFTERPHIVTFLFFAVTIWAVERRHTAPWSLWLLPPLFALWSNMHPELILSLVYLAATFAGDVIDGRRGAPQPAGSLRRELTVLGAATAATLANPEGWRVLLTPFVAVAGADTTIQIFEFRQSTLAGNPLFYLFLGGVTLLTLLRRESRTWSAILPLAALAIIGVRHIRATTAFAMVAAPFLHGGLAPLFRTPASRVRRWLPRVAAVAAAGTALAWTLLLDRNITYRWGYGPDTNLFPVAAADFILANDVPPNLFNHYNLGGYLIQRLYPKMRVFQDGRGPYPAEFIRHMERHDRGSLRELYDYHRINSALVGIAEYGLLFRAEEWGVVFWDAGYAVLVRRSPANLPILERHEYRAFLPGSALPQDRPGLLMAVREMRRNQAERNGPDGTLALTTGLALVRLRDYAGAEAEILHATELAPREPESWAYLSVVRSMLGRNAEAAAAAARARELDPGLKKIASIIGG